MKSVTIAGKTFKSLSEACRYYDMPVSTLSSRLKDGYTPDEAVGLTGIEFKQGIKGNPIVVDGKRFSSKREACKYYGLRYQMVFERMKRGSSIDEAFGITGKYSKDNIKYIEVYGKKFEKLSEVCKYFNRDYNLIRGRLRIGYSLEDALDLKEEIFSSYMYD